jgi:hypothetical protein
MMLAIIGAPIVVLIFTMDLVGLAFYLKWTRRPYARTWCVRFVHGAATLRDACYWMFLLQAGVAFLFLLPMLLGWSDRHSAALWGSVDLMCSIALYALWKWAGRLIHHVVLNRA